MQLVQGREDRANNQNMFLYNLLEKTPKMALHPLLFLSSVLAIRYQMLAIPWADWWDFVVQQLPAFYNLSNVVEASI